MQATKKEHMICGLFAVFLAAAFGLFIFWPQPEYFMDERRLPAKFPEISAESLLSGRFMGGFEKYATDAVPFRINFRRLKALSALYLFQRQDNHGIYLQDGYTAKMEYPLNQANFLRAAERFRYVYDKYLNENNQVFLSLIPDKNYFLAKSSGHLWMDYSWIEETMSRKVDFAEYIGIFDLLKIEDYYQTDTHWRQEKIKPVAERIAQKTGVILPEDYQPKMANPEFYGVYYGQSGLPLPPESLQYLMNQEIQMAQVFDLQNGKEIPVYDETLALGRDGYEMFLSGPLSLIKIENPAAPKDKKMVIFRDSFGSALAPLLIPGYSQIYLADIRYLHPDRLGKYIEFENSDILFLYSTLVLNHSETLK